MRHRLALLCALGATCAVAEPHISDVQQYCAAVAVDAREARYAGMGERMSGLAARIDERSSALEARTRELQQWIARREAFLALADEQLVEIYSAMRPDDAGVQLALLEPTVGAAIVMRLKPRQASAVLAGMAPERAAELVSLISMSRERAS